MVADNDYFYTTWGDNRLADAFHANQPDVRFGKIPVGWAGMASALAALVGPDGVSASRPAVADTTSFALLPMAPSEPTLGAALWADMREKATAAGWLGDAPTDDWATVGLIPTDLSWDGEAATWPWANRRTSLGKGWPPWPPRSVRRPIRDSLPRTPVFATARRASVGSTCARKPKGPAR
jgi:hypothetical protein